MERKRHVHRKRTLQFLIMTLSTLSYTTSDEILTHWLDQMLHEAIRQLASDIHIEPYAKYCRIRYRCDGLLNETSQIHLEMGHRLITLLKVMAKLNIAEKRLPQDGRFQMHGIDIRINVCPTLFGEKIVLRLLNSHKMTMDLNHLGMNAAKHIHAAQFVEYHRRRAARAFLVKPEVELLRVRH